MTVMRKIAVAAILLAGFVLPAYAQQGKYDAEDAAKKRDAAILDKQYKTILELTDKTAPIKPDPWQNMRGSQQAETPKPKN